MNAAARDLHPFPRHVGVMIGMVLAVIMALVAAVRLTGADIHYADAPAVSTLALRFEDRPDGSVAVIDAARGRVLDTVVGEAGFLRGTMRGLARERKRLGIGAEPEFHLIGRADGRLTLLDPATAQRIDLESFGPTNAAVFMRFMDLSRRPLAVQAAPDAPARLPSPPAKESP